MWFTLETVARSFKLDYKTFQGYAINHSNKYSLKKEFNHFKVSAGFVDKLVKDFKEYVEEDDMEA